MTRDRDDLYKARGVYWQDDGLMIWSPCDWDLRLMALAEHVSQWSKDPDVRVGAVVARDRISIGQGYNGFPRRVQDLPERYADKELKRKLVVHAEVNAILNATVSVVGCAIYSTRFPCSDCMKIIIQADIDLVITPRSDPSSSWYEDSKISLMMMREAGLELMYVEK